LTYGREPRPGAPRPPVRRRRLRRAHRLAITLSVLVALLAGCGAVAAASLLPAPAPSKVAVSRAISAFAEGVASTTTPTTAAPSTTVAPAPTTTSTTVPLSIPTTNSTVKWTSQTVKLAYGGLSRSYLLIRPATTSTSPLPVVVELSGSVVSASYEAGRNNFRQVAGPAILVYPQTVEENWDAGACCGHPATDHLDDSGFIATVVRQVLADQPDATHGPVYLSGYSNGAKMAMVFACDHPDLVKAIAIFGATRTAPCAGPPPVSILEMVGTADSEISMSGPPVVQNGFTEPTVSQVISSYLSVDGCQATRSTATAGAVGETLWSYCAGGRAVGVALFKGMNHDWPGGSGPTPSGQQVMWDFFALFGA
jgi:polyhydroxybutyrate depolymerase